MKSLKYFIQFIIIFFFFILFKLLGLKLSSIISGKIISYIGPFCRPKKIIYSNILKAFPNLNQSQVELLSKKMWFNYGRILCEYSFIKRFRNSKFNSMIEIKGQEILEKLKIDNTPVIFISGHFNNFELMAMHIEKSGINLAAVYRPLNNNFLNFIMENIRKKYICKKQIKKGISGTKKLLSFFKSGSSIALMIDQRVSEGIKSNFFKHEAFTTTIPAQFVKKFGCKVVPIYIERNKNYDFKLTIHSPIEYAPDDTIQEITLDLNNWLEKMILKNPEQWIWSHNRWK
jgi:Kdo2-lipid IVA lauroyltransferase/acyltransferase